MFNFGKNKLNVEKSEKKFKENLEKMPLEKGDTLAMIIAGLIIAVPVLLIVAGIVLLCAWIIT